jgi:hypothetical protein
MGGETDHDQRTADRTLLKKSTARTHGWAQALLSPGLARQGSMAAVNRGPVFTGAPGHHAHRQLRRVINRRRSPTTKQ